ncbi:TFIIB-type zinc ribbon-containing protein [Thermomonas carbonis]|uniref:TFIIB-type zinc ribbon-containing protein n=1 Tax=Thermomonas carbonis TaxID=1463158 RepID=A0A7G9SPJ9_9GAMM|nr:TFIIB-type zinc ribbon-containing protein [Thermomonas carbonis]QNN69774.1 TFIIB-type zinc ribbon-containing protein [Thermomonas carbonis]GHB95410.1 hypothetical protein GCM10010080_03620 [Thermomonas carbonis]
MSNTTTPPPVPPTGPGSPQDVPPLPGSFPIDPATLPDPIRDELLAPDPVAIDTSAEELKDGANRCPKCGATDIRQRPGTDLLICLYCRNEWHGQRVEEEFGFGEGLDDLTGTVMASGAKNIDADVSSLMTYKCTGCGAEVTVNTESTMTARCHWCRHVFGVNEQVANGAVPDAVLPFHIKKDDAVARIRQFVDKRRMFALKAFKEQFTPENVVGVYLPYMIVDGKASADVAGQGEIETRRYTQGSGDKKKTYYDADIYRVERHVDFTVDDLPLESSTERGKLDTSVNTNNIINTILPFDTKNAVKWNASYLSGYTSEKRDTDVEQLRPRLEDQLLSIARCQVEPSMKRFDRGVRWEQERLDVHGTRWVAMYLPVWLYSYHQPGRNGGMLHYIAVNGRTGETMGSVPVQQWKLLTAAITVGTFLEGIALWMLGSSS